MARNYRPITPFTVAMKLLTPNTEMVKGTVKKTFSDPEDSPLMMGSFRTFGGTESTANDLYTVYNTAVIDTWYRPDVKTNCRIYICDTGETYEIISEPEDIEMRHQYLQFRVQKVGGKA